MKHRNLEILREHYINVPDFIVVDGKEELDLSFSKEELFEKIWGYDYVGDSVTVTVHINRIREKIEEDSKNPKIIETVWGAGYRLNRQKS